MVIQISCNNREEHFFWFSLVLIHAEGFTDPDLGHGRQVYVVMVCHTWCYWSVSGSISDVTALYPDPYLMLLVCIRIHIWCYWSVSGSISSVNGLYRDQYLVLLVCIRVHIILSTEFRYLICFIKFFLLYYYFSRRFA